jgi:hypothetical protein
MDKDELAEQHSWNYNLIFRIKVSLLVGYQVLKNIRNPLKKFSNLNNLLQEPIISFSESELWNTSDNKKNWILTAGKVENLRIAARKLNGIEIKANEVFSFWHQIGNPNWGKGYVVGREVREGCIVPTKAGGLCQLSNALYDAALNADFDIIERHKHTQVIKGSLAEKDRDATVKWNYVDLRFKSSFDFRIEIELTSNKLIVVYKSKQKNIKSFETPVINVQKPNSINDCYSCGNLSCVKHEDQKVSQSNDVTTTFILDEKWPEFDNYIKNTVKKVDYFIVPLKKSNLIKTNRYSWSGMNPNKIKSVDFHGALRAIKLRLSIKGNQNVFELGLVLDSKIARAISRKISIETTHVVISQNLLPFIFETGVLGGRTYDVLMTRLPIEHLQNKLDFVYSKYPNSLTLKDFRANGFIIELENKALLKASKVVSPHLEIAEIFKNKIEFLNWDIPEYNRNEVNGNKVLFPASVVGRKGAYEIKRLVKELKLELLIAGGAIEKEGFWEDEKVERFNGDFNQVMMLIYPTSVEHQPRQILKAISKGIPIVTTSASGLNGSDLVRIVDVEDYDKMKKEVVDLMGNRNVN